MTAIVLGATSGVGYHIAQTLRRTREVVGLHRGHYPAGVKHLREAGVRLYEHDAGTTVFDVERAIELLELNERPRSVNVLVHSISGASVGPTLSAQPLDVEKTFNRLAHSFLWWVQRLVDSTLIAQHCTFVALTNPCPTHYLSNTGVIGAAKAALESYVMMLGCELGATHRVVGVRFSTVITPALEKVMPHALPGLIRLHNSIQPQKRLQMGADVGEVVFNLCQSEAAWINGTIVDATGGAPAMLMDHAFRTASRP